MIPEIGQFALILALMLALTLAVLPQIGASRGISQLVAMARPTAQAQFIFVAIAFCCLAYSFINNDFSVLNVATNSNSHLPLQYRLAATWGSHEGSLLLWTFMLTIWMVAVTLFSNHLPDEMVARVLGVMATISVGFLLFMLLTSNPFERLFCGILGRLRVCDLCVDWRQIGCYVGALVAALDHSCLDVSDLWHRAW